MQPHFNSAPYDTFTGVIEEFGQCHFSVVGTYGPVPHPVVLIHKSEHPLNCEQVAIDWETGEVVKFFGHPNPVDDCPVE